MRFYKQVPHNGEAMVACLPLPSRLAEIARGEGAGATRNRALQEWVGTLPEVISAVSDRWGLRIGAPYEPGGECSWVAPARNEAADALVLKVGWLHPEAAHEADGLRFWRGDGAVRLHAAEVFDRNSVLLLERCEPGTPLARAATEDEQDVVVAGLLRRLRKPLPAGHPFEPLEAMCDLWADSFEQDYARSPGRMDPGLAREGISLFRSLPREAPNRALLCTDLHAGNILASHREPWLVIDPKPYSGDPTYDPLQHMLNCPGRLEADAAGLASKMAALLDLDADRLRLWLFARCIQESVDYPPLYHVARGIAPR